MRKLRDFKCPQGHEFEALVNDDVLTMLCRQCSDMAHRQVSAPAGSGNAAHGFMAKARKR